MEQIQDYLLKTKSAVQKIYEAYNSYFELMRIPQRPVFFSWGKPESDENKIAYKKWLIENKEILDERSKRDKEFAESIRPYSIAAKFCIGRLIENIPIGLIIFTGRNQSMHYDNKDLREPNKIVFYKLANWYSPTFKKRFVDSYFDLNNKNILHYAENILYKLGWSNYNHYETDMLKMLQK